MSKTVIKVTDLGKEYVIGGREKAHETFREMLMSGLAAPLRRFQRLSGTTRAEERIWALKDLNFAVTKGEIVGIIGRNGAGKSTLLKILSRITEPTEGRVEIHGRVASLLEVGTGFHPELTGRENIYLNGAILGMTRREIDRKFDEIVDFAEVEAFLDTPVKRYSSGMSVRLAFAVAAHLEPDILIVDEVLAVGDAGFQKKCLGKMESVAGEEGRTVLLVSHNMSAIQAVCTRAVNLAEGKIVGDGNLEEQVRLYLARLSGNELNGNYPKQLSKTVSLDRFDISPSTVSGDAPLKIEIELSLSDHNRIHDLSILIHSSTGIRVAILDLRKTDIYAMELGRSTVRIGVSIPGLGFVSGIYDVGLYIKTSDVEGDFFGLQKLDVIGNPVQAGIVPYPDRDLGLVAIPFSASVDVHDQKSGG